MLRATQTVRKPAVKADKVIDSVALDHEGRHRRHSSICRKRPIGILPSM